MTQDKKAKQAARALAATEGISYAAARRRLTESHDDRRDWRHLIGHRVRVDDAHMLPEGSNPQVIIGRVTAASPGPTPHSPHSNAMELAIEWTNQPGWMNRTSLNPDWWQIEDLGYEPGEEHYDYIGACATACRAAGIDVVDDVDWPEYREGGLELPDEHDSGGPLAAACPWEPDAFVEVFSIGCALAWSETRGWWIVWELDDGTDDRPRKAGRLRDLGTEMLPAPVAVAAALGAVLTEGSDAWNVGDIHHMRDPARESDDQLKAFDAALAGVAGDTGRALEEGVDIDPMGDHDDIGAAIGDNDEAGISLAEDEMWDWAMIEDEWLAYARARLAEKQIAYNPQAGRILVPAAMTDAEAMAAWEQVRAMLVGWVVDVVIEETHTGKPQGQGERTGGTAWVRPY